MNHYDGFAEILAALKALQQGQQTLVEHIAQLTSEMQAQRDACSRRRSSCLLDAGERLTTTTELLEMILLHVYWRKGSLGHSGRPF